MLSHRALLALYRLSQAARLSQCIGNVGPFGPQSFRSGSSTAEAPALKTKLRELYKRVHPDLFHDYPLAKDSNEHSFKLLQVPQTCPDVILMLLYTELADVNNSPLACAGVPRCCQERGRGGPVGRRALQISVLPSQGQRGGW